MRRTAVALLETYLGRESGERVLTGGIKRGQGQVIHAVLWYCDMRNFTELTEQEPLEDVIALLNRYFEIVGASIEKFGGEILKFIGDGVLAIFPLRGSANGACFACAAALDAALEALDAVKACSEERLAEGKRNLRCGIALDRGEVMYGNVGTPSRLDFTVIGPAVNLAARLEDLTHDLDPPLVVSSAVASSTLLPMRSLGHHKFKGIEAPQEAFTLDSAVD